MYERCVSVMTCQIEDFAKLGYTCYVPRWAVGAAAAKVARAIAMKERMFLEMTGSDRVKGTDASRRG
jgi:hypothetical protein